MARQEHSEKPYLQFPYNHLTFQSHYKFLNEAYQQEKIRLNRRKRKNYSDRSMKKPRLNRGLRLQMKRMFLHKQSGFLKYR